MDHHEAATLVSSTTPTNDLGLSRKRPSVTTSEEPRQKRKVTRACDLCKTRKAKCSGTQPCETCAKRGLTCLYEALYLRGRPPTPELSEVTRPSINTTLQRRTRIEQHLEVPSRGSPEIEVAGQYSDSISGLSFLHRAWKRLSSSQANRRETVNGAPSLNEDHQLLMRAGDKPFQNRGNVRAPSLLEAQGLVNLYFDVCIATHRLLHRPTLNMWLETTLQQDLVPTVTIQEWGGLSKPKAAIVLLVLAIATFHEQKAKAPISIEDPVSPGANESPFQQSDGLFSEACRLIEAETGFPKLESAQARLIQVLYLLTSSRMNQAWYKFGNALQIISALGLHRRDRSTQKRDYIEDQCRKRTFWVAYTLDKYLGVIFGRPRHYHDDDIDQEFPDRVNDEDMTSTGPLVGEIDDCHIESLIFHAKHIVEKISREVYSIKPIPYHDRIAASHRLSRQLHEWRSSLPPFLGAINPSSLITSFRRQATALKLAYSHVVMLAHRPFLLKHVTRDREMREMAKQSASECISAAQSVLEAVDRMARDGKLFHAFWLTHYVCFCALSVTYVWAIQQSDLTSDTTQDHIKMFDLAERCMKHIEQATSTNSPSRRYSIILQELRAEAKRKTARHSPTLRSSIVSTQRDINQLPPSHQNTSIVLDQSWESMFGSPIDLAGPGMSNFLNDWQTTDWLHLDSSAFGSSSTFDDGPMAWVEHTHR
ncbi:hypothetical protein K504DRAFT_472116 [Pleomassaria siparia CBS 279.74]|uniref:Zn(2)-C6 fungal-type domain-containing protein n=1 Tax=Pleomassaria siparia CBS 279.74 TaxID=1314801 RepID=A0A6G1JWC1_9PLEO|nr:hypothetical protein K504DRAFT_472116 [Pleomassaria siparia CBS 279.74]